MSNFTLEWDHLWHDKALLHCTVSKWNVSSAKELDAEVGQLFNMLADNGYTEAYTLSPNKRFCAYMGGEPIAVVTHEDEEYWVYKWELK